MNNCGRKSFSRRLGWRWVCLVAGLGFGGPLAEATDTPPARVSTQSRDYRFDKTISRQVLKNYLSRSISMEGVFNGKGDLDDIRMLTSIQAKYIGRSLCLWGAEAHFIANVQRAKEEVSKLLTADPDMILEACVFETVGSRVDRIAIPDWVFGDMGQPVEHRSFRYADMIYPEGQRRSMGPNAQVPDESRLETRLWFYYQATSYIAAGFEAIHFDWVWGYDEITWFAHQTKEYRARWLQYAWNWVRQTDPNGFLEMPGSRTAVSPDTRWYFANNPSPTVPTGLGDEAAIRAVWDADAGKSRVESRDPSAQGQ